MKTLIQNHIEQAIDVLIDTQGWYGAARDVAMQIEHSKNPQHGDFACNIAMQLAPLLKQNPRAIATQLVDVLSQSAVFERIDIAGPGFINIWLSTARYSDLLKAILLEKERYGCLAAKPDAPRVLLEFVSANPTGPLHVGHGRSAAYGATLANVLRAAGLHVDCEYYVNDAGRQMDILALSVYLRYADLCERIPFYPVNAYQGDYVIDIARALFEQQSQNYQPPAGFFDDLPIADYAAYCARVKVLADELAECEKRLSANDKARIAEIKDEQALDKKQGEALIDVLIAKSKAHLGERYSSLLNTGLEAILTDIKDDLQAFGVHYQCWFSERSLFDDGKIQAALKVLDDKGYLYHKDGNLWFKTSMFGDEKDRVVQRQNGLYTYFASDIAYHHDKIERGYDTLILILGADHHGYMARVKAALAALGHDIKHLRFELVQFAVLYQGDEKLPMSTRSGQYVTLRDLRAMIGNDAVRFFYALRKPQQHMDFDLDLARQQNKDNPLYYVQYAHARICRLFERAGELGLQTVGGEEQVAKLHDKHERDLLRQLDSYHELILAVAKDYAPHQIIHYLKALAASLHGYYDAGQVKFLAADKLQLGRFTLLAGVRQVLANGLCLLGVDAPEAM